jgi:predicted RND superfamily exporter protein
VIPEGSSPSRRARSFVEWTVRNGRWLWLAALLLCVPATWRTAQLYMHLKSDLEALLPRDTPSVKALDELRSRMEGLQYLGVVLDVGDPKNLPAGEKMIDELAARVRAYPPELVRGVRLGDKAERDFIHDHASMYVNLADLKEIRRRIEARRDYQVEKETGNLIDADEPPPSVDFSDIRQRYDEKTPKHDATDGKGRYSSTELHVTMMLIEVGGFQTGGAKGPVLLSRVKADVQAMGGTDAFAPGMRIGYSGDVAISVEETAALIADLSLSSVLVIFAVVAVIVLYYRWWRSVLVLVPPLLVATVLAFGIASLPPFDVSALNSNTAFLGSIIVGNGINFGIVLLARYVEERRRGTVVLESLVIGVWSARVGTLSAALAAGVSYASLVITQFQGFRQFGIIGGLGMALSWAVSFLLMPPLVAWLDKNEKTAPRPVKERTRITTVLASFVSRFRIPIAALGAVLTVCAAYEVSKFDSTRIEYDFSKLRRADTWTKGEGYWGRRMDGLLGEYLTPTVVLADDREQARGLEKRLKDDLKHPPMKDLVSTIRGLDDVLPPDEAAKVEEVEQTRADMTDNVRAALTPDERKEVDRMLGEGPVVALTAADLPRTFTTAMRERDGSLGKSVLVYPHPSKALWEGPPLAEFVRALRAAADSVKGPNGESARVAGSLPISADILASIQHDGPLASACAFFGVVVSVVLLLRWRMTTLLVILSLTTGVLWLAAATMVLGVKINFANFIAFPITFGIGVDYAVNVLVRYEQGGRKDILEAVRSTGSAVALCSLTTIIGYSSLLLAENRALFLFGLVAVMGEIACLTVALTVLPAAILVLTRRRS